MIALMAPLGLITVVACLWCVLGARHKGWAMVLAVGMLGLSRCTTCRPVATEATMKVANLGAFRSDG
ncbi:hypothetical protein C7534_120124 [Pseudomonas sp. OV226]|nr:hypothetical protein C7534_120124 [Pseudomonas sp. OV226]